ncbi:NACHT, LRR and PYD domains-containing protein 3-like [Parambassis ranga]|uniref:NACHT, LRR and PYD domains-containing protein 3-like n=1 Tax=Parambassis ranga TaxID=210632 RepID=A0A6P7JI86_9TELE|nr:NACHT, LRR and PYD domains-containing protein 3-like [Parambassis ranga]
MDDMDESMASPSGSFSFGRAVSERGENEVDEDEDIFYIPERRPSLDLGPTPMDTSNWHYVEQALNPAQSYRSMTSEENSDILEEDQRSFTQVQLDRADSFSSCYSFDSDDCEKKTPKVKSKEDTAEPCSRPELIQDPNEIRHPSLTVGFTLKAICDTLQKLSEIDMQIFKRMLWRNYPQTFNTTTIQSMDILDLVDRLLECYTLEVSLQITKHLLTRLGQERLITQLQTMCLRNEVRYDLRETLRKKYCEDVAMEGEKKPFADVFTNLHITTTSDNGPNIEHEVMTIKKLNTNRKAGTLLSVPDIFSAERMRNDFTKVKFIVVIGSAGSGKTMAIRKLILDWIEERSHQHIGFLFPLPFRELKQFEGSTISLLEIIQTLYPATKKLRIEDYRCSECKLLFVFEGLDEYTEKLDFETTDYYSNFKEPTTLNIIVVNLMRGRLHFQGLFLITARPQTRHYLPWDTHYDKIELRGFLEPDKDEYFKKWFKDPEQAARVIEFINSSKTLRIMCHLPLFCSLVAEECQHRFREQGTHATLPSSITYMYTKLLFVLLRQHRLLRAPHRSADEERDFLMKLGKVAFTMLEKGEFRISKSHWKATGVSDEEAVVNSGLCTLYVTRISVMCRETVLSFIHPTVQEYLAALYTFLSSSSQGKSMLKGMLKAQKDMEPYKTAVDKSLKCEDGKLDLFLRFLFGMLHKPNLELLQSFVAPPIKQPVSIEDAAGLLRKRIRDCQDPNRKINLQCCLEELGVHASDSASHLSH